ncbi:hypothetical protein LCGC14_0890680 [marine sediment metagenome]|uniref:Uncharacterized protein n=1 Tax=marine sediment metagenome TaxID=412755 RepID=A0A0F9RIQ2_9ZZZZ
MNKIIIDSEQLDATFRDCLFKDNEITNGEIPEGAIIVEGIVNKFGFHPVRLTDKKQVVYEWLNALPHQFHKNSGGGWSFLNACQQENGIHWTGFHRSMEQLFCLGIGLGAVKCQLPREVWKALPGGVPYYVIDIA